MYRLQIVLQGRSNVAEDQFVNTVYVDNTGSPRDTQTLAGEAADAVQAAYTTTVPGAPGAMVGLLSRFINGQASSVRLYDMTQAKPRTPFIAPFAMNVAGSSADLPEEVALCLSIHGAPPVTNRRRGRIYLGPLNTSALDEDQANSGVLPSRPTLSAIDTCRGFGENLHAQLQAKGLNWMIQSSVPTVNYVEVVGGWVDNAWDTQRRRGVDPTLRRVWPASA